LVVTAVDPLKEVPVRPVPNVNAPVDVAVTVPDPPRLIAVPLTVMLELARPELGIVVLMADAGMLIVALAAVVIWPCPLTVNVPTVAAFP
jgi:hypothetical protein